jgi:hypothetical protein
VALASKKQCAITISNTKFKYMALSKVATKAIWLRKLLEHLGFVYKNLTTLFGDNQSSFALAANPKFHDRSKHKDIQYYHFIRK